MNLVTYRIIIIYCLVGQEESLLSLPNNEQMFSLAIYLSPSNQLISLCESGVIGKFYSYIVRHRSELSRFCRIGDYESSWVLPG